MEVIMHKLLVGEKAPDFELPDYQGILHKLSEVYKNHYVLLVFNFGFS
jgi:peroxiredoxin